MAKTKLNINSTGGNMPEMRRPSSKLSDEESWNILEQGEYGYLATVDHNQQPYGVPLNYVIYKGNVYFHCAMAGHKLDNLRANSKVSFSVVGEHKVLPADFSTKYKSVIVFGEAVEVEGIEKTEALKALVQKYSPDYLSEGIKHLDKFIKQTTVICISITRITGKSNRF